MTRKTKKGIVGKKIPTSLEREEVGVGISFTQEHVYNGDKIEALVQKRKQQQDLQ